MKLLQIVKCDGYQRALASMVYKFFDKTPGSELHKPVIKSSKEEKSMQDLKTIYGQQI